ncbi:putative methyltransferase NSUN7, partial [Rhinichthys klamathensis goyatoka]|uniref:putative methyltransferase NSUN7 n=1 Tax=Rhinichthys klamathensis goyatoka TaxID=3034132 RepID=UPI0024B4AEBF
KSCCVGPWALRPLLAEGGDVLMTGCFSARTVAHVSALSAHTHTDTHISPAQSKVIVCVGDEPQAQKDELQNTLAKMGCKNVKLLPVSLGCVDVCDVRLQEVRVALVMPACSLSAISNPVDYIMQENRDPRLMLDLSHGSVSPEKLQTLACRQRKDLQRVGQFPQVRAVLYSTCSVHSEENEEVLKTILSQSQENHSTAPPYRLSSPGLLQDSITEDEDDSLEMKASFFRLEASDHHNGCFVALLTRQPEPEVKETSQQVLARAAAKGLLDGLHPKQPISREGRGRRSRRTPANHQPSTKTRPHATQSDQSRVAEFLNHEMRGSNSAPMVSPRSSSRYDPPSSSRRLFQGVFSRTGHTPSTTGHTFKTTGPSHDTAGHTPNTAGHTPNTTGPSHDTTDHTPNATGHTPNTAGSTSNTPGHTSNTTGPTFKTTGSTSNTPGHTSNTTGPTFKTTGSTSNTPGHTSNTTGPTFKTTGSTFKTTGSTSHITGPAHNTTGSTPNLASFSDFYCTGLTGLNTASASVIDDHYSTPVAPPKGRQEVLRPTTVMFPPVLSSSDGLLPQRRSHALISPAHTITSPAHTHQHWSNSTPAPPRTQAAFRARLNHLRPWL